MTEERKNYPCIYNLHTYCIVEKNLRIQQQNMDWGSVEWIKLHCSLCVKAVYARSKAKLVNRFSVVNTL